MAADEEDVEVHGGRWEAIDPGRGAQQARGYPEDRAILSRGVPEGAEVSAVEESFVSGDVGLSFPEAAKAGEGGQLSHEGQLGRRGGRGGEESASRLRPSDNHRGQVRPCQS